VALHSLPGPGVGHHIVGWEVALHSLLGPEVARHIVGWVVALHSLLDHHIQVVGRDSVLHSLLDPAMGEVAHTQRKDWIAAEQAQGLPCWGLRRVVRVVDHLVDQRLVGLPRDPQTGHRLVLGVLRILLDLEEGRHIRAAAEVVVLRILDLVVEEPQILGLVVVEEPQILGLVVEEPHIPDQQEGLLGIHQEHRMDCSGQREEVHQLEHQKDCSDQLEGLREELQMGCSYLVKVVAGLHKMACRRA